MGEWGMADKGPGCAALNAEHTRLLGQRDDLNKPQLSMTDDEREAELTQLNGMLFTVAKAQSDESCPAVVKGPAGSVVR